MSLWSFFKKKPKQEINFSGFKLSQEELQAAENFALKMQHKMSVESRADWIGANAARILAGTNLRTAYTSASDVSIDAWNLALRIEELKKDYIESEIRK